MRAKLKRRVGRGTLTETEPGLFAQTRPKSAAEASDQPTQPTPTAKPISTLK
jgi:hypothetical protein